MRKIKDSRIEKEFTIMDLRNREEEIRLKDLKKMTKEDALYTILNLINNANYFPCGYSHTIKAYDIIEGIINEKN